MASEKELNNHYKTGYMKLLDELKHVKHDSPEAYDVVAQVVRNYRDWVMEVAELNTLPEVPSK